MKTSMQELYESTEIKDPFSVRNGKREYTEREKGYLDAMNNVRLLIKHNYIEQEKSMIIDSFVEGFKNCEKIHEEAFAIQDEAEQYYNEKFKTN